jgi:hypothetical protein
VTDAGWIFHVEAPAEWHEPLVALVPLGGRFGGSGYLVGIGRIADGDERFGIA